MAAADVDNKDAHDGQHIEERPGAAIERLAIADWRLIDDWGIERLSDQLRNRGIVVSGHSSEPRETARRAESPDASIAQSSD